MPIELILPIAFAVLCGLAAATAGYGAVRLASAAGDDARLRQRLRRDPGGTKRRDDLKERAIGWITAGFERLSRLVVSDPGERKHDLRRRLIRAGVYEADAPRLFVVARVVLLAGGLGLGWLFAMAAGQDWMLTCAAGGGLGYFLPQLWLRSKVKANHKSLERGLPDGLDLMVVCVEAGLTVDAAMRRVGEELALAHPPLARELSICHMETQIGLPRAKALKNLGDRTGYAPLQALTAMLIQADRFGTSIAMALRIQAEGLRVKRQHRAEEAAAKASVKLTFPLVLFIFPASFIVLAGPTVLKMMNSSVFN